MYFFYVSQIFLFRVVLQKNQWVTTCWWKKLLYKHEHVGVTDTLDEQDRSWAQPSKFGLAVFSLHTFSTFFFFFCFHNFLLNKKCLQLSWLRALLVRERSRVRLHSCHYIVLVSSKYEEKWPKFCSVLVDFNLSRTNTFSFSFSGPKYETTYEPLLSLQLSRSGIV